MTGPARTPRDRPLPSAGRIALFVSGYTAAYLYSNSFRLDVPVPFWCPDAVLLCALLLSPRRTWWSYLLLALPTRLILTPRSTFPFGFQLATYANDCLQALLAAAWLRRLKPKGPWLSSVKELATFGSIAVVTVPALSALGGVAILQAYDARFLPTWSGWFLGDSLAILLLTPMIVSFSPSSTVFSRSWRRAIEAGLLVGGLVVSGIVAFRGGGKSFPDGAVLLCVPFPFLLWAATRFGVRGTSAALSLFAVSAVWAVSHSARAVTAEALRANVLSLQLFLLVIASSLLFLTVVLEERRTIEENLRSAQARLARAEATSMVMVAHVGLDGRFWKAPRRLAQLLGYSRPELLEHSCNDLTPPSDLEAELREIGRLLTGEIPSFQIEKRLVKSDGAPVWFYLSRSVIRDSDGRPVHFLDYLAEIDERKRAEAAVARSEKQLRLFAEHSPAAVAMLDGELRFVMASRRFRNDFQRDGSPIVGRRYDEALAGFPRRWPDALRRCLEGVLEACDDDTFTRPDGTIETLRWEIMPCAPSEGPPSGAFVFAELTTERKRGERALEELRQELAHVTRVSTLGELSGALAHELNQPLAAILANAQAAQTYLSRGPSGVQEVASILEDIVSDDLRASDVIRSLRKLLRNEQVEFRDVDFNGLVREVLELAQGDLITRNVTVLRNLASELPPIRGDRVQLQQVLLNLIVNACEAMAASENSDRRLRVVTSLDGDGGVHVAIQDSGPGVPEDIRNRIFDPFLTTKNLGLGLGLTICRSLVMAHGGRLWLADNETGGASFHVVLPRTEGRT